MVLNENKIVKTIEDLTEVALDYLTEVSYMGAYFNPGNESFLRDSRSEIYIDKTGLLEELNRYVGTSNNCILVSHARRFGKSQAAGMIDAYYSCKNQSKELFEPFEIAGYPDFETFLNKFYVIHIDVSSVTDFHENNIVNAIIDRLIYEFKDEIDEPVRYNQEIQFILKEIYQFTHRSFVIILDEWDCLIRNMSDRQDLVHEYLKFLHALFKSEESKSFLALGYITGILPIKKLKDESALNNFREYTMLNSKKLTKYYGFTEGEVKSLCERYDMDFASARQWYDGYLINGLHMYNPNSVCQAMMDGQFDSYWKNTSAFGTINQYITLNYDGLKEDILKMLSGERVSVNTNTFQNDFSLIGSKDDALTALIHLGYLAYDMEEKTAYIPNYEVGLAYQAALSLGGWNTIARTISRCDELLRYTISQNEEKVSELVELAHDSYTSVLKYNDENSLSCVITMAYFTAPAYYNIIRELPSGKGFADFAFIPRNNACGRPAMIIELKWDDTADSAIHQIKTRKYTGKLSGYGDKILLVGISYRKNDTNKKHECIIETADMNIND